MKQLNDKIATMDITNLQEIAGYLRCANIEFTIEGSLHYRHTGHIKITIRIAGELLDVYIDSGSLDDFKAEVNNKWKDKLKSLAEFYSNISGTYKSALDNYKGIFEI